MLAGTFSVQVNIGFGCSIQTFETNNTIRSKIKLICELL